MSLTRKKIEDSLSNLYYVLEHPCAGCSHNRTEFCNQCNVKEDLSNMRKLIHEHFDNPPLTFEELDNMIRKPIWDNKYKKWVLLREIIIRYSGIKELELTSMNGTGKLVEFEDNRFYRKQVD